MIGNDNNKACVNVGVSVHREHDIRATSESDKDDGYGYVGGRNYCSGHGLGGCGAGCTETEV